MEFQIKSTQIGKLLLYSKEDIQHLDGTPCAIWPKPNLEETSHR